MYGQKNIKLWKFMFYATLHSAYLKPAKYPLYADYRR